MPRKNLLTLHEAIVVALINTEGWIATFEEIALFIEQRNLYSERKGNIPLSVQVMLRSTKSGAAYHHLFEQVNENPIRLKDSLSDNSRKLQEENDLLKNQLRALNFQRGIDKIQLGYHEGIFASAAADLLINPNPIEIHGTEKGKGHDFMIGLMNIVAIKSEARVKHIYLKEVVIPREGGKKTFKIETNESFESLLNRIQKSGNHILRVHDSYAVNIYHYELSEPAKFSLIAHVHNNFEEHLRNIKIDKKFDLELYHTRLMEIDRLQKYHADISINVKKIEEINRYKNR